MIDIDFTPFPMLTTERLTLRQLSKNDRQGVFALRSHPEINRFLNREPCATMEDADHFIDRIDEQVGNNRSIYWAISLTDTSEFVGTICLFHFSTENSSCEIGFELLTQFQGQGMMKEAVQVVTDFAFRTLNFRKIVAFAHFDNLRSRNLLLRSNFVRSMEADEENPGLNIFTLARQVSLLL